MLANPPPQKKMPRKPNSGQNIKVFVRCRPMNSIEKASKSNCMVECQGSKDVVVRERPLDKFTKTFTFDKVFAPDSKQLDVYKSVAKPLVEEVLNGFNCTIFAYGQTGTGKTFTMEGEKTQGCSSWQEDPLSGIIPRCVNHLFDELRIQKLEFTMRVSFLELYNEELFDLLSAQDDLSKLRLYEDSSRKGSCIIQGLEEVLVRSKDDVYHVIEKGSAKRQTAATLMNAHSSRSHTVFTVTIHIKENTIDGDELLKTGKLHLVDLAGSENIGRSGAIDKRAREAGNINQSLLTLGRVISSLVEKAPHVPYRESKLTRLLQDALGGRTKTSIIATVSPASINLEETLSTLDYAHRAKNITNKPEVNQKLNKKELIGEYTEEIERLRLDLMAMREKNGVYLANENYQEMIDTLEQQTKEITDKIAHIRTIETELEKKTELFENTKLQLEDTEQKLGTTRQQLKATQTLLHNTAQELDEQKYLVSAHLNTEQSLQKEGSSLIHVADLATTHVSLLHDKIDRKRRVEEQNTEESVSFEGTFSSHINSMRAELQRFRNTISASLDEAAKNNASLVSTQRSAVDSSTQRIMSHNAEVLELTGALLDQAMDSSSAAEEICSEVTGLTEETAKQIKVKLRQHLTDEAHSKVTLIQHNALQVKQLTQDFQQTLYTQLTTWQDLWRASQAAHNASCRASLQLIEEQLQPLVSSHQKQVDASLDALKDSTKQHQSWLQEMMQSVMSKSKEFGDASVESINALQAQQHKTTDAISTINTQVCEGVREEEGREAAVLKDYLQLTTDSQAQLQLFSTKTAEHTSAVCSAGDDVKCAAHDCTEQVHAHIEELSSQQSESKQRVKTEQEHSRSTMKERVEDVTKACGGSDAQCASLQATAQKLCDGNEELQATLSEAQLHISEAVSDSCSALSDRQNDVSTLFTQKMIKDTPTGQTPGRQDYRYPRILPATSPHERLLRRYRVTNSARHTARVPLPMPTDDEELNDGSSFSSIEDSNSPFVSPNDINLRPANSLSDLSNSSEVFVMPSSVIPARQSRDDGALKSAIPAPVKGVPLSAPVSRSASASSISSFKENKPMNNVKKLESKSSSQSNVDKLGVSERRPSRSKVLTAHNS